MTEITVTTGAGLPDAMSQAVTNRRWAPQGTATDPVGSTTINLPAGDYTVTDLHGLMGAEGTSVKIRGLRFQGAGSDLTHVVFSPLEAGALAFNQFWQNVAFEGITFATTTPGSVFMRSVAVQGSAPQEYTFTDVKWTGPWKYAFDLHGTNNNCEFRFYSCATSGMAGDGTFLHVGKDGTSDQFLNYWFYGFKHWNTDAPLVDMARGGHVHLFGVDASAWGNNLTKPGYLINLRGHTHAHGVQTFTATGLRVEAKNAYAGLLYSEWVDGNVSIQCDWSSQTSWHNYGDIIHLNLGNSPGAVYNFHDSNLSGGVKVEYGLASWATQPRIVFRDCNWRQRLTPSEAVTYIEGSAGNNLTRPAVRFEGCRNVEHQSIRAGVAVWDAVVGRGVVRDAPKRSLMVQGVYGNLRDADTPPVVHLPVGAVITGCTIVGDMSGAWTVSTSEVAPQIVADTGRQMRPFLCSTRAQATIAVRAQGVRTSTRDMFLLVEGYW